MTKPHPAFPVKRFRVRGSSLTEAQRVAAVEKVVLEKAVKKKAAVKKTGAKKKEPGKLTVRDTVSGRGLITFVFKARVSPEKSRKRA